MGVKTKIGQCRLHLMKSVVDFGLIVGDFLEKIILIEVSFNKTITFITSYVLNSLYTSLSLKKQILEHFC